MTTALLPQHGATRRETGTPTPTTGYGKRLASAMQTVENLPALRSARDHMIEVAGADHVDTGALVAIAESDPALTIALLRAATQTPAGHTNPPESVVAAVSILGGPAIKTVVSRLTTYDPFARSNDWKAVPERFRFHAIAVQVAAGRIARDLNYPNIDRLMVGALLHDVGTLALMVARPGYPGKVHDGARNPNSRLVAEQRTLGVDHALVGGVMLRRWGLPATIAKAVERHHDPSAIGDAAIIRLADMVVHYAKDGTVSPSEVLGAAHAVGLDGILLQSLIEDLPCLGAAGTRRREHCPLTCRELEVLTRLAAGKIYKTIAVELNLSISTVRSHLHNVYGKIGVTDRAQAVLYATRKGWL